MTRALSSAFGLLMVAAGAIGGDQPALVASAAGVVAVVVGVRFTAAATLAVLTTVMALVFSAPSPALAAVAGLAAGGYLVLRHAPGGIEVSVPTMVGAVGITAVALIATVMPVVPWVPLVAPLAVLLIFVMAVAPLLS